MKPTLILIAVLPLVAGMLTCSGDGGSGSLSTTAVSPDVTGTWDARFTITGGTVAPLGTQFSASFMLVQTGTMVTGTFPTPSGGTGEISGTIMGRTMTFTVTESPPCAGSFSGTADISSTSRRLDGSGTGTDCNGTASADFTADKR
jgi:hypothetical protein